MKNKKMLSLAIFLGISTSMVAQDPVATELSEHINPFTKAVTQFQQQWKKYTQCLSSCSAEQKQQTRQLVTNSAKVAFTAAIALIVLVYTIKTITDKQDRTRRTLKIELT